MSISANGFRMHRHPQDSEMDFTWQELMAITELQVYCLNVQAEMINAVENGGRGTNNFKKEHDAID